MKNHEYSRIHRCFNKHRFHRSPGGSVLSLLLASTLFPCRAPANQVLLFYDATSYAGQSRYEAALVNRGYPYQLFTAESSFTSAVQSADPATDMVIVDSVDISSSFSSVTTFIQAGGRALVQYWNMGNTFALASALEVNVAHQASAVTPPWPNDWGGSTLFHGVTTPLVLTSLSPNAYVHGQKFQPISGGQAVAGFVPSPTANQAALVIGNSGRTIAQGFFMEEVELTEEAVQLAQNQLDLLFGPIAPATAPWITTDPQNRVVLAGGSVTLRVQVGGSLPLACQWQKDGTNILGATNAFHTINNAQPAEAGYYSVVVTNDYPGTVTSIPAMVTVTNPASVLTVLLMDDENVFASPYESALLALGMAYQPYNDPGAFNSAVAAANPADTLVILDAYGSPWRYSDLVGFVQAGGRAIMQNWDLNVGTHLARSFDVSVIQDNTIVQPVYDWGGSGFFDAVATPIVSTPLPPPYTPTVHGQKLQPINGARAVAGFSSSPTANQAAIVIGNGGRTVVNGFMFEEVSSATESTRLAQNQILFLNPLKFETISHSGTSVSLRWTAIPYRNYQVRHKDSPSDPIWTDLGFPVTAFDTTASTVDPSPATDRRIYRVQMLP